MSGFIVFTTEIEGQNKTYFKEVVEITKHPVLSFGVKIDDLKEGIRNSDFDLKSIKNVKSRTPLTKDAYLKELEACLFQELIDAFPKKYLNYFEPHIKTFKETRNLQQFKRDVEKALARMKEEFKEPSWVKYYNYVVAFFRTIFRLFDYIESVVTFAAQTRYASDKPTPFAQTLFKRDRIFEYHQTKDTAVCQLVSRFSRATERMNSLLSLDEGIKHTISKKS